jgi:hypothetical protein
MRVSFELRELPVTGALNDRCRWWEQVIDGVPLLIVATISDLSRLGWVARHRSPWAVTVKGEASDFVYPDGHPFSGLRLCRVKLTFEDEPDKIEVRRWLAHKRFQVRQVNGNRAPAWRFY